MLTITAEIVQPVVDALAPDLPYPINVMDETGRIVASTDPTRVGQLHPGARVALGSREPVIVETDGPDQRRGANLPIIGEDGPIGVVGITGPPLDVVPMARLVLRTVTMALEQRARQRELSERQVRRESLVARLTTHQGEYPPDLLAEAGEFGLDMDRPHAVVLVSGPGVTAVPPATRGVFTLAPSIDGFLADGEQALAAGIAAVRAVRPAATLAVGPFGPEVSGSLRLAAQALWVAARLGMTNHEVYYADVAVLCSLARVHLRGSAADSLREHPDLIETLRALIRADGDLQAAAADLHVHRNTLTYRIGRIASLTGWDPRRPLALVHLAAELLGRHDPDAERSAPW